MAGGGEVARAERVAACISALLVREALQLIVGALLAGGETPEGVLTNAMREYRVFNLTGCTVDEALYYVSCGSPVFAMTGGSDAVLLTGYDSSNVILYDPALGASRRVLLDEADDMFADAGSIFITYLGK